MRFILLTVVFCLTVAGAHAAESDVRSVPPEGFLTALAQAPQVAAARARLSAARRGSDAAGVLPDPKIGIDIGRGSPRTGSASPMYGAFIEQSLPRWGERDAERLGGARSQCETRARAWGESDTVIRVF